MQGVSWGEDIGYFRVAEPAMPSEFPVVSLHPKGEGRLQTLWVQTPSGVDVALSYAWLDTQLDMRCSIRQTSDGLKCLPVHVRQRPRTWGDSSCTTTPLHQTIVGAHVPTWATVAPGQTCELPTAANRVGELHEGPVYVSSGADCSPSVPDEDQVFYRIEQEIGLDDLASVDLLLQE